MLSLARSLQHICSSRWYFVGALALVMVSATGPGEVITLVADCYWTTSKSGPVLHTSTESQLIVRSPLSTGRPVYMTGGFKRTSKTKSGQIITYTDTLAIGMLIRTYAWDDGEVKLVDGILTPDGHVMVDGRALTIATGPGG